MKTKKEVNEFVLSQAKRIFEEPYLNPNNVLYQIGDCVSQSCFKDTIAEEFDIQPASVQTIREIANVCYKSITKFSKKEQCVIDMLLELVQNIYKCKVTKNQYILSIGSLDKDRTFKKELSRIYGYTGRLGAHSILSLAMKIAESQK